MGISGEVTGSRTGAGKRGMKEQEQASPCVPARPLGFQTGLRRNQSQLSVHGGCHANLLNYEENLSKCPL